MSTLVSWPSKKDLGRGLFPFELANPTNFLSGADFDGGIDSETEPNNLVGTYNGNPANIADWDMSVFVMPAPVIPKNIYDPLSKFTELLTEDELGALLDKVSTVRQVQVFWEKSKIRNMIDFNEAKPVALLTYLVQSTPEWTAPRATLFVGG